jgi:hypothetical protein
MTDPGFLTKRAIAISLGCKRDAPALPNVITIIKSKVKKSMKLLYNLTPTFLNWLASGQLGNKFQRTWRIWWLIEYLYQDSQVNLKFDESFTYSQLKKQIFAPTHPLQEDFNSSKIQEICQDKNCLCQQSIITLVTEKGNNLFDFEAKQQLQRFTGFNSDTLELHLESCPFATVHRSLRDDLKQLIKLEFLTSC